MPRKKKTESVTDMILFGEPNTENQTNELDSKKSKKKPLPEEKEEEVKVKKISPFDIINFMFKNQNEEFNAISQKDLERNYFIINDRMSIGFPLHAEFFNHYKLNFGCVVKCWRNFIQKKGYRYAPNWLYTKGKQKTQEEKKSKNELTRDEIRRFALANNVNEIDIDFLLKIDYNRTYLEIQNFLKEEAELEKLRKMTIKGMTEVAKGEEEIVLDTDNPNQTSFF